MSDLSYKRLSENSSEERRSSENMGFGREDGVRGPRRRSEMRVEIEVSEMRRLMMVRTDRMRRVMRRMMMVRMNMMVRMRMRMVTTKVIHED